MAAVAEAKGVTPRVAASWRTLDPEEDVSPPGRPPAPEHELAEALRLVERELDRQGWSAGEGSVHRVLGGRLSRYRVRWALRELKAERRRASRAHREAERRERRDRVGPGVQVHLEGVFDHRRAVPARHRQQAAPMLGRRGDARRVVEGGNRVEHARLGPRQCPVEFAQVEAVRAHGDRDRAQAQARDGGEGVRIGGLLHHHAVSRFGVQTQRQRDALARAVGEHDGVRHRQRSPAEAQHAFARAPRRRRSCPWGSP